MLCFQPRFDIFTMTELSFRHFDIKNTSLELGEMQFHYSHLVALFNRVGTTAYLIFYETR